MVKIGKSMGLERPSTDSPSHDCLPLIAAHVLYNIFLGRFQLSHTVVLLHCILRIIVLYYTISYRRCSLFTSLPILNNFVLVSLGPGVCLVSVSAIVFF